MVMLMLMLMLILLLDKIEDEDDDNDGEGRSKLFLPVQSFGRNLAGQNSIKIQPKLLWDAFITTSSKLSVARRWSN